MPMTDCTLKLSPRIKPKYQYWGKTQGGIKVRGSGNREVALSPPRFDILLPFPQSSILAVILVCSIFPVAGGFLSDDTVSMWVKRGVLGKISVAGTSHSDFRIQLGHASRVLFLLWLCGPSPFALNYVHAAMSSSDPHWV